jgi:hypothetical protein
VPAHSVTINGRNFLLEVDGQVRRVGFYTTREVEAADAAEAEVAAIQCMREDAELRARVRNPADDPPMLFVEEIAPIDAIDPDKPVPGLVFYDDGSEDAGAAG